MKVFISWSGNLSKNLAEIFREWLPAVIQAVKPYYTPDDITKGARWNNEISKELEECKVGIICLTRDNLEAPWIMFEAGSLSKNIDKSKVCPVLFGVDPTDIQGPLVQFQAARFNKEEIKKVVKMINVELGDRGLATEVLDSVFEMWWPKLKEKVDAELKNVRQGGTKALRSERDLLEEILKLMRALPIPAERQFRRRGIDRLAAADLVETFILLVNESTVVELDKGLYRAILQCRHPIEYMISQVDAPQEFVHHLEGMFRRALLDVEHLVSAPDEKRVGEDFTREDKV